MLVFECVYVKAVVNSTITVLSINIYHKHSIPTQDHSFFNFIIFELLEQAELFSFENYVKMA